MGSFTSLESFAAELWESFVDTYFSADPVVYENLGLGSSTLSSLRTLLVGLFIGVFFAGIYVIVEKRVLGAYVRELLRVGAVGRENAKTLYELGYHNRYTVRFALTRGTSVRRVVKCLEEEEYLDGIRRERQTAEEAREAESENGSGKKKKKEKPIRDSAYKHRLDDEHFYIPEDEKDTADMKFDAKGTSVGWLIVTVVLLVVMLALLMFFLPQVLGAADTLIGSLPKKTDKIL